MPMPSAYETRSDAFFRLYEGETPQEIRFPNCIGKPRFSTHFWKPPTWRRDNFSPPDGPETPPYLRTASAHHPICYPHPTGLRLPSPIGNRRCISHACAQTLQTL